MILKNNIQLKQNDFINEKELQSYFEKNITQILGYKFIDTEFSVGNFRIDTLAFDVETKSFKIIEYKNVKNHSLTDQGNTYLKLILERKADFVLQYNLKTGNRLELKDIDWTQTRVIFVSPIYNTYQINATDFKNIPINLIKITRYEDDIIDIEFIKKTSNATIEELMSNNLTNTISREIKVYTEEDHLIKASNKVKEMYETIKNRILELDDIDIDVKKVYIAFKGRKNIVDIEIANNKIRLDINMKKGTLNDPLKITRDISNVGHWGNGDYQVELCNIDDIDNVIPLIKQSLNVNKK